LRNAFVQPIRNSRPPRGEIDWFFGTAGPPEALAADVLSPDSNEQMGRAQGVCALAAPMDGVRARLSEVSGQ